MIGRRRAREAALQILYFWDIGKTDVSEAFEAYFAEHDPDADMEVRTFAAALVSGTTSLVADLDKVIEQHSQHWRVERLAVIDRLILRMATWELQHGTDTPPAVVLNEALELARRFSTDESVRFVNGVLDAIRKSLEPQPS